MAADCRLSGFAPRRGLWNVRLASGRCYPRFRGYTLFRPALDIALYNPQGET
jgi:hypothetical protein